MNPPNRQPQLVKLFRFSRFSRICAGTKNLLKWKGVMLASEADEKTISEQTTATTSSEQDSSCCTTILTNPTPGTEKDFDAITTDDDGHQVNALLIVSLDEWLNDVERHVELEPFSSWLDNAMGIWWCWWYKLLLFSIRALLLNLPDFPRHAAEFNGKLVVYSFRFMQPLNIWWNLWCVRIVVRGNTYETICHGK